MKSYLLSFNNNQISRKRLTELINEIPEVVNWYGFFPGAIALVSTVNATELGAIIREKRADEAFQFLIVEKGSDSNGWLPKAVWEFLNKPTKA